MHNEKVSMNFVYYTCKIESFLMNFGINTLGICNFVHNWSKNLKIKPKLRYMEIEQPNASLRALSKKVAFFQKNQLGIGLLWRKLAEIGHKLNFRALFSKIYIKIEVLSILKLNYTSAPIAQLVACLTFFI